MDALTINEAAEVSGWSARMLRYIERVCSLVLLGDLVSCYLAALAGVDPSAAPPLSELKELLAAGE